MCEEVGLAECFSRESCVVQSPGLGLRGLTSVTGESLPRCLFGPTTLQALLTRCGDLAGFWGYQPSLGSWWLAGATSTHSDHEQRSGFHLHTCQYSRRSSCRGRRATLWVVSDQSFLFLAGVRCQAPGDLWGLWSLARCPTLRVTLPLFGDGGSSRSL